MCLFLVWLDTHYIAGYCHPVSSHYTNVVRGNDVVGKSHFHLQYDGDKDHKTCIFLYLFNLGFSCQFPWLYVTIFGLIFLVRHWYYFQNLLSLYINY